jgi:D-alanyl-D-alanine dipeptidase
MKNISPTYKDLLSVKSSDNGDLLVVLNDYYPKGMICSYQKADMYPWLKNVFLARSGVAKKLKMAAKLLESRKSGYKLLVVYAYRHPLVQKRYFLKRRRELALEKNLSGEDLNELTHNFVAVPSVAGHPCGAAVDVTIVSPKEPLDMGTAIADFAQEKKIVTYNSYISNVQKNNRLLLRSIMLEVGFAPFDGEWWHFSYGDREWAYYYKRPYSLYEPISLTKNKNECNII